jgi:hypothetical protein
MSRGQEEAHLDTRHGPRRCAEDDCTNEATMSVVLEPIYEADPPIQAWYVDRLRHRSPDVGLHFHEGTCLRATIPACARHVGELADTWDGWLYGDYDPIDYGDSCTDEDLALFGWVEREGGRLEHVTTRPGPPVPLLPIAGASDHAPERPGSVARRARRKQQRQARRQGRR